MKKTRAEKALPKNSPRKRVGSGRLVRRSEWTLINRKHLPQTGIIIAGSYRDGEWTISSPSHGDGFPSWADADRTHYFRLPSPPNNRSLP